MCERLRREALRERRSMAACIRDAILVFLNRADTHAAGNLDDVAGRFRPLPPDDLKPHDRLWANAVVRERSGKRCFLP